MIHLLSQTEAEKRRLAAGSVHNISPYINPAHFLAPPRGWLEALLEGEFGWHFLRLRYKNLLRNRFREEPERFFALLDGSEGQKPLYLTCHCLSGACHGEIARDFLEILRTQEPYRNWRALRTATLHSAALHSGTPHSAPMHSVTVSAQPHLQVVRG